MTDSYAASHIQQVNNDLVTQVDIDSVQKLAMHAMSVHSCQVQYFLTENRRGWNFHITGAYQQVMIARGMILKDCPVQVHFACTSDLI